MQIKLVVVAISYSYSSLVIRHCVAVKVSFCLYFSRPCVPLVTTRAFRNESLALTFIATYDAGHNNCYKINQNWLYALFADLHCHHYSEWNHVNIDSHYSVNNGRCPSDCFRSLINRFRNSVFHLCYPNSCRPLTTKYTCLWSESFIRLASIITLSISKNTLTVSFLCYTSNVCSERNLACPSWLLRISPWVFELTWNRSLIL